MSKYGEFSLDWLAFTYRPEIECDSSSMIERFYCEFPEIRRYFNECVLQDRVSIRPGNHYQISIDCCNYFFISYDDNMQAYEKGVNVQIPSHGLHIWFELLGIESGNDQKDLYDMIRLVYSRHCTLSRIDLCFDDFTKTFRPHDYLKWLEAGNISHNFKARAFFVAASGAETLYFGKMRSDKFLRIYDKFLESDGAVDSVRYEFEIHGRPAKDLGKYLLENEFDFGKYLLSWFKVLDPLKLKDYAHFADSPILPEWESWLNLEFSEVPTPIKVPHSPRKTDAARLTKWQQTCKWATYTAMVLSGNDGCIAKEVLGITEKEMDEIPLKYKRILLDYHYCD